FLFLVCFVLFFFLRSDQFFQSADFCQMFTASVGKFPGFREGIFSSYKVETIGIGGTAADTGLKRAHTAAIVTKNTVDLVFEFRKVKSGYFFSSKSAKSFPIAFLMGLTPCFRRLFSGIVERRG